MANRRRSSTSTGTLNRAPSLAPPLSGGMSATAYGSIRPTRPSSMTASSHRSAPTAPGRSTGRTLEEAARPTAA